MISLSIVLCIPLSHSFKRNIIANINCFKSNHLVVVQCSWYTSFILFYDGKLWWELPSQKLGLGRLWMEEHTVFFSKRRKNSSLCAQPTPSQWSQPLSDILIYSSRSDIAFLCGMYTTTSITALLFYSSWSDCIISFTTKSWSDCIISFTE